MQRPTDADVPGAADYLAAVISRKWWIVGGTALAAVLSIVYALSATRIYRSEAVLALVENDSSTQSLVSSVLGASSFAADWLNVGGESPREVSVAFLKSRYLLEEFIRRENLLPVLFPEAWDSEQKRWIDGDPQRIPSVNRAVKLLKKSVWDVREDRRTGLLTLSIEWDDPAQGAAWTKGLVSLANQLLRERAIAESHKSIEYLKRELERTSAVEIQAGIYKAMEAQIRNAMLANVREDFAFRFVDPPSVPDRWDAVRPHKRKLVMVSTLLGFLLSVFVVLLGVHARGIVVVFRESQRRNVGSR